MPEVRLGEVLSPIKDEVPLQDDDVYVTAGILSYGKGLFERPAVLGAETSYKSYFRIRSGQFVYSKLFAWEGALAVVDDPFDRLYVSPEFPTFDIDQTRAEPAYIRLLCGWEPLWVRLRAGVTGMGGRRKRVHPASLLAAFIPLPSVESQRRIVDVMSAFDDFIRAARRVQSGAAAARSALDEDVVIGASEAPTLALGDIAQVVGGVTKDKKRESDPSLVEVPYLRVANVQRGWLDLSEVTGIRVTKAKAEALKLLPGDVLFNEGGDRDKLGRGWVWEGQVADCIHQNHVFRARPLTEDVNPYFLSIWGNSRFGRGWFEERGSQTTNLASLNLTSLKAFPVPSLPREQQNAIADLHLSSREVELSSRRAVERALALRPALLGQLCSGDHEIPDSYDDLLSA